MGVVGLGRWGLILALGAACNGGSNGNKPDGGDADADADADADGDADADADADPAGLDCDKDYETPEPGGGGLAECVVAELTCEAEMYEVFGSNEGGTEIYDYETYEGYEVLNSAFGQTEAFDGPERIYQIYIPPNMYMPLTVISCANVDVRVLRHDITCDPEGVRTPSTGSSGNFRNQTVQDFILGDEDEGRTYELIIDAYNGGVGNYKFAVECFER